MAIIKTKVWSMTKCNCGHDMCDQYKVNFTMSDGRMTREDATLVVAAPKMLDALKEIVAFEDRCRAKGDPAIADHWYYMAKHAIEAAESR